MKERRNGGREAEQGWKRERVEGKKDREGGARIKLLL